MHKLVAPQNIVVAVAAVLLGCLLIFGGVAQAVTNPQSGSIGLEGTISSPPPTQAATITTPGNGQSFTSNPITIAGLCTSGLLVKVFSNNVFIGSVQCANGSFSLKADLFNGGNDLTAQVYDALGQQGPDSNTVHVTFTSAQFATFGTLLSLTSDYAERGANPGEQLTWPITIVGGIGPYALSVDWGDGASPSLMSEQFSGAVTLTHTYQSAGTYEVLIQATDKNGEAAFLQVVSVVNGAATQPKGSTAKSNGQNTPTLTTWAKVAMIVLVILLPIAFWLGRRHELFALRRQLERNDRS